MNYNLKPLARQAGFSILSGLFLALILFAAIILVLAGPGINSAASSSYSNSARASSLLTSASYIQTGFNNALFQNIDPSQISFGDSTNGVFNAQVGGVLPQILDPQIFVTTATHKYWIYRGSRLALEDVGGAANTAGDYTMIAADIKLALCRQLNNMLHGDSLTATPPAANDTLANIVGPAVSGGPRFGADTGAPNVATLHPAAGNGIDGRLSGCYQASSGEYVYIHTLLPQ